RTVATFYLNIHSLIAFRVLSFNPAEKMDVPFLTYRLRQALEVRETFYHTPYYRLIHAEADQLPGLIIDRFDSVFVVQLNTQGMENLQEPLLEALKTLFNPTTIILKKDSPIRQTEGLTLQEPEIIGEAISHLTFIEK